MPAPYWTNRLCTPQDTPAIMRLVRAVHGDEHQEINEQYWSWRYLNDTEFRAQIVMSEVEGQPIGIQPLAIFDWQRGSERLKGAMYTGVLTHPDHRRRGVFKSLVESSNDYAKSVGAMFSMTLPNDASLPGFLKTNEWEYPGLIPMHLKVASGADMLRPKIGGAMATLVGWMPQLRCRTRGGAITNLECERATDVPDELDDIADAFARDSDTLMIRRTAAYWRWRYLSKPASDYRTFVGRVNGKLGGAVTTSAGLRAGIEVGMIMDLVARGGVPAIRALLRAGERDLRERGIGLISCQASTPMMKEALRLEGFREAGPVVTRKRFHFVYRPTGVEGWPRPPKVLADWHLTFGDSDNA